MKGGILAIFLLLAAFSMFIAPAFLEGIWIAAVGGGLGFFIFVIGLVGTLCSYSKRFGERGIYGSSNVMYGNNNEDVGWKGLYSAFWIALLLLGLSAIIISIVVIRFTL